MFRVWRVCESIFKGIWSLRRVVMESKSITNPEDPVDHIGIILNISIIYILIKCRDQKFGTTLE